jgi:hypothetical protein
MCLLQDGTEAVENKDEVRRDTMPTVILFHFKFFNILNIFNF